jgi:prenyltransferase beta subunit
MKRLRFLAVLLIAGVASAASITRDSSDFLTNCANPSSGGCNFQVDINGNMIAASGAFNGPMGLQSLSSTTINSTVPGTVGQVYWCNSCTTFNGAKGGMCASTGTAAGAFIAISSLTAVSPCK